MEIQPVHHHPRPRYPDKYDAQTKELLLYCRPKRWLSSPAKSGILAFTLALGLSGCSARQNTAETSLSPTVTLSVSSSPESMVTAGLPALSPLELIAGINIPLFNGGEGTGTIGCVSITAPQFLSEEEAYVIIKAELSKVGIGVTEGLKMDNALLPAKGKADAEGVIRFDTVSGTLKTDSAVDLSTGIEFLSIEDYSAWDLFEQTGLSISEYDFRAAAEKLTENEGLAVFYDPAVTVMPDLDIDESLSEDEQREIFRQRIEEAETASKAESIERLKAQVQGFLEWLQAQGVI